MKKKTPEQEWDDLKREVKKARGLIKHNYDKVVGPETRLWPRRKIENREDDQ